MHQNLFDSELTRSLFRSGQKFITTKETLTGTWTMGVNDPQVLFLDPGGAARTVLLPAETDGLFFVIQNTADAAEAITVQEDSATTTIATLEEGAIGWFFSNGTTWYAMVEPGAPNLVVNIPDAATYTVLAANSGKVHVLPDLTADIVITLPTPARGLSYEFWYGGAAADAQDWQFDSESDTNYFVGGVVHLDTDAGSAGDEVVPVLSDGNSNSKLNVLVPDVGTKIELRCDGTLWYLNGQVVGASAPTYADQ